MMVESQWTVDFWKKIAQMMDLMMIEGYLPCARVSHKKYNKNMVCTLLGRKRNDIGVSLNH